MSNTLDLITLAEAKSALNITDNTDDTLIAQFVTAASLRIDDICGPVVVRTVTAEPHDGIPGWPVQLANTALTITTVTEYDKTGNGTVLTAETASTKPTNAYLLDGDSRTLWRRAGGNPGMWALGRQNVLVTYQAGRYANTAAVDPKFKLACSIMVHHLWRAERGGAGGEYGQPYGTVPFSVPNAVLDLLNSEIDPIGFA